MGITHYWKLAAPIASDRWIKVTAAARRLIESRSEVLSRRGEPSEPPTVDTERIVLNGRGIQARETFELVRVPTEPGAWVFCKTTGQPYDEVVTAVLLVLKLEMGDAVSLRSDCDWRVGWAPGRRLVEQQLGLAAGQLAAAEEDLRPRPDEGELTSSLKHFLRLPERITRGITADLRAEASRRLGFDLVERGFFLMPRDMVVTKGPNGASELTVDLLAPYDAFTHPARIAWQERPDGSIEAHWLELPEAALAAYLAGRDEARTS